MRTSTGRTNMATFSRRAPETEVNSPAVNAKGDFDGDVSLPGGSAAVYARRAVMGHFYVA